MCLRGRVGDVPLPGCGLWAGPHGAVAVTGDGEFIAKEFLANHVYNWLETGMDAQAASDKALTLFPEGIDIGLIVVGKKGVGGCSNREMPWSVLEGEA